MQPSAAQSLPSQRIGLESRSSTLRRVLGIALLLLLAQIVFPLQQASGANASARFIPLTVAELESLSGGCYSNCGGSSSSGNEQPYAVGAPYWEYSNRALISRPDVPGYLVWQRVNSTPYPLGPFTIEYETKQAMNWQVGTAVPSSYLQAHLGSSYEVRRLEKMEFVVPPNTYYKWFVKYPYERWRYYYTKWQDYSDNSRVKVGTGDATVYQQWTKTNAVYGPAY